jgi:hypothetical protein
VVTPPELMPSLGARQVALELDLQNVNTEIDNQRRATEILALDEESLRVTEYLSALHKHAAVELTAADARLRNLKQRQNQLAQTRDALLHYAQRVSAGFSDDPRAHLRRVHHPDPTPTPRPVLQIWAALSGAIALLAVGFLLVIFPPHWWLWALALALAYGTIEAAAEGRLIDFLLSVTVILGAISALILVWEFWRIVLVIALALAIALMIRDNVRELRGT